MSQALKPKKSRPWRDNQRGFKRPASKPSEKKP